MNTIQVKADSGRSFEVPALFVRDVFAVNPRYLFYLDGKEPDRDLLPGYFVTHIPTGATLATFTNKRNAQGFCRWMAKYFPGYDPSDPMHEKGRKWLMPEISQVAGSYQGWITWAIKTIDDDQVKEPA